MKASRYTEEQVREWVCVSHQPVLVSRMGKVVCVNPAFASHFGIELNAWDGRALTQCLRIDKKKRPARIQVRVLDFQHEHEAHVRPMGASRGKPFEVWTLLPKEAAIPQSRLAELLVEIAAQLLAERSETGVEEAVVHTLSRSGWFGTFCTVHREGVTAPPTSTPFEFSSAHAQEAMAEGRPVFRGDETSTPHVYLPIHGSVSGRWQVFVLAGPSLVADQSPMLSLFAKQVSTALANARLAAEDEQRNAELRAVAGVARLVAQAQPVPLEAFLMRVAKPLGATEVVLELEDARWGTARIRVPESPPPTAESMGQTAWHRLTLPFLRSNRQVGTLSALRVGSRPFDRGALDLLQTFADLLATALERRALQEDAVRRERLAALGELSAVVAHEVRNPLGALVNALAALRPRLPEGDAHLLVALMTEEADRLNRIVGNLLDFARPRTPELEPENVGKLIEEAVDAARASLRPDSPLVEFSLDVPVSLPRAQVDRRLFRQALLNVALNAADAMPDGGTVKIRASHEEREGRPYLRVDVVDSGMGMRPERLPRIFEPFFTTKAQGTGLGLAVVKRIMDEHKGDLEVDSSPGQGTRFTFRFPLSTGEAHA